MNRQVFTSSTLRVLAIHNHYQQPGGEDQAFAAETRLLEAHGDEVIRYTTHNDRVASLHPADLARKTLWNKESFLELRSLIRERRPDVMHAHNTFPLISPAAYAAAREEGVPVVQTLHNFRLVCANGLLFRDGHVCEDCIGRSIPWPAVVHKCYRHSLSASGVVAAMQLYHRAKGTWQHDVDLYIALTEFARAKLIEGGLPAERIVVKPNFVDWECSAGQGDAPGAGDFLLYVGRLSEEKGIRTLLAAWNGSEGMLPLRIVGDGPLKDEVLQASATDSRIQWLGYLPGPEVQQLLRGARALVLPSECYEMFPLVVLEAFSMSAPVIGSRTGSLESILEEGKTGMLFETANSHELADRVRWACAHRDAMAVMGKNARAVYLERYTGAMNYRYLRDVYARASAARDERSGKRARDARMAEHSGRAT
jgi:glycosyltransferase involved in cell wall biosynthesis